MTINTTWLSYTDYIQIPPIILVLFLSSGSRIWSRIMRCIAFHYVSLVSFNLAESLSRFFCFSSKQWCFRSLDQLFPSMCLTLDLPDCFLLIFTLNLGAGPCIDVAAPLSLYHTGGSWCQFVPLFGGAMFDHLIKVVSVRLLLILVLSIFHPWF